LLFFFSQLQQIFFFSNDAAFAYTTCWAAARGETDVVEWLLFTAKVRAVQVVNPESSYGCTS
jgi:hypothetical protein